MHVVLLSFTIPAAGVGIFHTRAFGFSTSLEAELFHEWFPDKLLIAGAANFDNKVDEGVHEVTMITADHEDFHEMAKKIVDGIVADVRTRARDSVPR
ncbi:MAG: hypothetical protein A3I07_03625 [Candidatus Doudnabacteria bacterium RIFCSPLOWO2_02_FULL_42_9]|uniref:Uncharacterized protein n=1 Tax=Candidatus Doudnabacteria bacterium RIFCSPHIGHO2_01_FULL_41_86 TaxID=1817821 RepID=A0A1F5N9Q3_9BACT|nr:MAG: hypothetical protein A2717_02405 [Candidatus Doudnabacteria bacterium RIFCSPHIGHO2_01_FULL_41_86]OGE75613.1 MAG: hypothetical protein A3K07_02165 [Candidatus Doudnabacteria bacterium RIFCSPHIGHO2_01_43_10]OGE85408.1 MAG: hypothetical protein A3E28_01975 [Candidatus Doudnabacteria bacterium RIFCSPHIGHO2_12_FULL_42_22]OGE86946.1 MAG: hypothetical protein A3C49_02810 [Candidatus Doudnabacteria bacterium RIFCSPHIGHO2_02_FULL_42_25]OGE92545.1 MAG: hypothetical protein A2895_02965 [Candidatus